MIHEWELHLSGEEGTGHRDLRYTRTGARTSAAVGGFHLLSQVRFSTLCLCSKRLNRYGDADAGLPRWL
jgi:hypothetical protein